MAEVIKRKGFSVMEEKLTDITIDLLLSGIGKKVNYKKEDFQCT